jgi:hypothetical protein
MASKLTDVSIALWLKFWVAESEGTSNSNNGRWVGIYTLFAAATMGFIALETGSVYVFPL